MDSTNFLLFIESITVRLIGLEPTRLTTPDPKSGAATNYATSAIEAFYSFSLLLCKDRPLFLNKQVSGEFSFSSTLWAPEGCPERLIPVFSVSDRRFR